MNITHKIISIIPYRNEFQTRHRAILNLFRNWGIWSEICRDKIGSMRFEDVEIQNLTFSRIHMELLICDRLSTPNNCFFRVYSWNWINIIVKQLLDCI